jgi:hypothetical protein
MNEYIVAAVVGLDETKALLAIEPLNCTRSHKSFLLNVRCVDVTHAVPRCTSCGRASQIPIVPSALSKGAVNSALRSDGEVADIYSARSYAAAAGVLGISDLTDMVENDHWYA